MRQIWQKLTPLGRGGETGLVEIYLIAGGSMGLTEIELGVFNQINSNCTHILIGMRAIAL